MTIAVFISICFAVAGIMLKMKLPSLVRPFVCLSATHSFVHAFIHLVMYLCVYCVCIDRFRHLSHHSLHVRIWMRLASRCLSVWLVAGNNLVHDKQSVMAACDTAANVWFICGVIAINSGCRC